MSKVPERQHTVNEHRPAGSGRTPAGDAFSELVVRLFRVNGLLATEGEALTRPAGQSTARWQVLAVVEDAPATVAQIARILGLARQSVQRVADALAATGLVRYVDNPRHRRARLVELTDRGRGVLGRIQAEQRPWADALGAAIGERQLRQANALLDGVLSKLAARSPKRERNGGEVEVG
jgi:DNA-binding MarR family transcriptional regulator